MAKRRYESMGEVPANIFEKLGNYVTNPGGKTFAIHGLPPEVTGGLLARYSRASTGTQLTLINEFFDEEGNPSQEKGSELMDRVLNAFGDDSVGELEGIHVGIEDISQLGTKFIEDRRIGGSPIEQSTRYVKYDRKDDGKWRYLRPKEIIESGLIEEFEETNDRAFEVYSEGIVRLQDLFRKQFPRESFEISLQRGDNKIKAKEKDLDNDDERRAFNTGYNFTIRCAALDVGRCILPASTLTHLGVYGNGRFFTGLLNFLKSSNLHEANDRAFDLENELNKVIPTFIKRNKGNPNIHKKDVAMRDFANSLFKNIRPDADKVTLITDRSFLDQAISYSLFPYTNISLKQIHKRISELSYEKKIEIIEKYVGNRESRRDRSGRGLEAGYPLMFDLVGGFAEYRDLERHRMLTQQRQLLTTELGFIMPSEMAEVGLEKEVQEVVDRFDGLFQGIRSEISPEVAQYGTLFNHRMRFAMGMNLREFQHLSELRTQPAGHFSYRSMVMEMADKVKCTYSWAGKALEFVDYSDPGNKISRAAEQSKISGKNLASGLDSNVDF